MAPTQSGASSARGRNTVGKDTVGKDTVGKDTGTVGVANREFKFSDAIIVIIIKIVVVVVVTVCKTYMKCTRSPFNNYYTM